MQGMDRWQRASRISANAACSCQEQSRADNVDRNAALVEGLCQLTIRAAEAARGTRHLKKKLLDRADVKLLGHDFFRRAAISSSLSRTR